MPEVVHIQLSVNRRRLAKRLIKLFDQIAVSDAKKFISGNQWLPIFDPNNVALQAAITLVKGQVEAVIATR